MTLELRGFEELEAEINQWPGFAIEAGQVAMESTLLYLHGQLPPYPEQPGDGAPSPLRTDRQRRWFFGALARGEIELPYRRGASGGLGGSFTTKVEVTDEGVIGAIGTNKLHAPWVVGPDYPGQAIGGQTMYQAHIHQGRWWQFDKVIAQSADEAEEKFVEKFFEEFEGLLEGVR